MKRKKEFLNYREAMDFAFEKGGQICAQIFEGCQMVYIVTFYEDICPQK